MNIGVCPPLCHWRRRAPRVPVRDPVLETRHDPKSPRRDSRAGRPASPGRETRDARPAPAQPYREDRGKRDERAAKPGPNPATKPAHRREPRGDAGFVRIYGFHAVVAALRAPRRGLIRLYATAAAAERLAPEIAARGVETKIVSAEEIAARTPRDAVHQGVLLEARPLEPIDISEVPARGLVLVLDQITDPHNVGAILRTAAAFAVDALVTTERHSPEFTGALAKSASGGLEFVPICSVVNLARALEELGDLGYWRVGLDSEAPEIFGRAHADAAARAGPRRGGQGPAATYARALRRDGASRTARRHQEPQRFQRLRDRARARARKPSRGAEVSRRRYFRVGDGLCRSSSRRSCSAAGRAACPRTHRRRAPLRLAIGRRPAAPSAGRRAESATVALP